MNIFWMKLIEKSSLDDRLMTAHMAIIVAIIFLGTQQGKKTKIYVSRSRLMKLSQIKTAPTYHKYFKELQEFGYLKYTPSYHPGVKSYVEIKF